MLNILTSHFAFYSITNTDTPTIATYLQQIPAGFPSPAADYIQEEIDFNAMLLPHPSSTYIVRVLGDSMIEAFIPNNALLVVDRSIKPANNNIVVAIVNGEFTIKRFIKNSSGIKLMPANPKFKPMHITEDMDFAIWGTVTKIITNAFEV
ncbi:LexA family protein [Parasediminibacterium sp. JCM 36343]|uniref:LexA family protein n=1 Tax=Parasediminibacterium sp. JCM 36343 TaxID=3374279 RepID=UPI003979379A